MKRMWADIVWSTFFEVQNNVQGELAWEKQNKAKATEYSKFSKNNSNNDFDELEYALNVLDTCI